MLTFLNPLFLWAAAAAGIPLLLHLLQRRRTVRVMFSTIRFLKLAQKRSASRVRLENLLLWLLRTLLMLLIALAFAVPVLRTRSWGNLFGNARRDVAIVWDVSYSMGYESGHKQVWDDSRATVASIIQSLKSGDRVCLYLAADDVVPLIEQPSSDLALALSLVKTQLPHPTTSSIEPAVLAAVDALRASGQKEREIYVVTDGQALPWSEFRETSAAQLPAGRAALSSTPAPNDQAGGRSPGLAFGERGPTANGVRAGPEPGGRPGRAAWNPKAIDRQIMFYVAMLGAAAPQNTAPLDVEIQPAVLMAGAPAKISVRLGHTGPAQNTAVSLVIDDQEQSRRTAALGEDRGDELVFPVGDLSSGVHPARVETTADGLTIDNDFYFLLRVRDQLPILCVGSDADTFFLMRALNPRGDAGAIQVRRVEPPALDTQDLDQHLCVFLCNALPLTGQAIQNVERFVRRGGVLVLFPGDHATPADYAPWTCLPGKPARIEDVNAGAPRMSLRLLKPTDPVFRSMKMPPGTVPMVHILHQLAWTKLADDAEIVLAAAAEKPFLIARPFGKGRVLMFSVSPDRRWSDLPLTPFFLPFVQQITQFSAGAGREPPWIRTARTLALNEIVGSLPEGADLTTPQGETLPIRRVQTENEWVWQVENVTEPGIYRLARPGGPAGKSGLARQGGSDAEPVLAANVIRSESDLRPILAGEIPALLGIKNVSVSRDKDDLMRRIEEHRVGRPLGETLLWVALALAMLELFVANRQSRQTPGLSERLRIDLAGKVRSKVAARRSAAKAAVAS